MSITIETNSIFSGLGNTAKNARGLVRSVHEGGVTLTPERTKEETRLESSTLSFQKELTPEEEKRVRFLKDMMAQLLTMSEGQPTEEQKARIKEIEKELEKITGVKMKTSISNVTEKIPGKKDKEDEKEKLEHQIDGMDPKEALHSKMPEKQSQEINPGMQMLQRNSLATLMRSIKLEPINSLGN